MNHIYHNTEKIKKNAQYHEEDVLPADLIPGFLEYNTLTTNNTLGSKLKSTNILSSKENNKINQEKIRCVSFNASNSEAREKSLYLINNSLCNGIILKQLRELFSVSLSEMVFHTKIPEKHLIALEQDDYDTLPGVFYIKGFLTSYLKYLGFEKDIALFVNKYLKRY